MADPQTTNSLAVPMPPSFSDSDPLFNAAVDRYKRERGKEDLEQKGLEARTKQEQALGSEQETTTAVNKKRLDILTKQLDMYGQLEKASDPNQRRALIENIRTLGEMWSGRFMPNTGLRTMGADAVSGRDLHVQDPTIKDWQGNEINPDLYYKRFTDPTSQAMVWVLAGNPKPTMETESTTVDSLGNVIHTSKVTGRAGAGAVPAAPTHLGGGGSPTKEMGEEEYKMAANGAKLSPKLMDAANRYAVRHNLPAPVIITPADRKSLGGLGNLEKTFPDLEKYSSVLDSSASRLKLQEIVNQVSKGGGSTGIFSSLENLIGAGVNAALVKSLTPPEQKFLIAYNQAREAVQTMRQFAGVSRSTQALYNAMAALIPNPYQTRDQSMAKQQLKALKEQIQNARASLGTIPKAAPTDDQTAGSELDKEAVPTSSPR